LHHARIVHATEPVLKNDKVIQGAKNNAAKRRIGKDFAPIQPCDRFSCLLESAVTLAKCIQSPKLNILIKTGRAGGKF